MTLVSWSAKLRNGPIGCFSSVSSPPLSEKIIHFIIGVELIYSVVLVSDVQQSDSVYTHTHTHTHIYIFFSFMVSHQILNTVPCVT